MPVTRPALVLVLVRPDTELPLTSITPLDTVAVDGLSTTMPSTVPVLVPPTLCTMEDLIDRFCWFCARMPNVLAAPPPMSPADAPPITVWPLSITPIRLPTSNQVELPASETPAAALLTLRL
jgi:hypothetical protein